MVKNYILFVICFLVFNSTFSQQKYPQGYFRNPLNIPIILAGNFGEIRSTHFHSGLDIKTQHTEGLKVVASADGYVSRIKISLWGYGKAVYIKHSNGYTTVYGHLESFSAKIESYVKQNQYKEKSYTIQLFPKKDILKVKKGALIGYSGSTGGAYGPHLHFEIRDTKSEKPINPLLFGFKVADHSKPTINKVIAYPLNDTSQVNQSNLPVVISLHQLKNGSYLADKIIASGIIGLGINTFDRQDGSLNKNGTYSINLFDNGKKVYESIFNKISFRNSSLVNLYIDYYRKYHKKQIIQQCFIVPKNNLDIYPVKENNGYLKINNGFNYTLKIEVNDIAGNKNYVTIPVIGQQKQILIKKISKPIGTFIKTDSVYTIQQDYAKVTFYKNTFYKNETINFNVNNLVTTVHQPDIPVNRKFLLSFNINKYPSIKKDKLYIAYLNGYKGSYYIKTEKKDSILFTRTKKLGKFVLKQDLNAPIIKPINFKNKQWLSNYHFLKVMITDKQSGIKKYVAKIDGNWILMEYNPKKGMLTYNFNDIRLKGSKHLFTLKVTDNLNNSAEFSSTFYRKK